MKSHKKTSKKTDIPSSWISALFKKFHARYGHKWSSSIDGIEEIAVSEWKDRLAELTGDQIKHGLESWDGDWPPSSEEFKKACIGKQTNEFGLDYVPEVYRKRPERRRERLLSNDDRDKNRKNLSSNLKNLRDSIKKHRPVLVATETLEPFVSDPEKAKEIRKELNLAEKL